MALGLDKKTGKIKLQVNTTETKILGLTGHRTLPICINGANIEAVEPFVHELSDSVLNLMSPDILPNA